MTTPRPAQARAGRSPAWLRPAAASGGHYASFKLLALIGLPRLARGSARTHWRRLHQVDNVFVAGGSVLPANGGFNPVLTILAVAFRAGEHIARTWKGAGVRQV